MKEATQINSVGFVCNFVLDYIYQFEVKDEQGISNIDVNNIKFQKILYFLYGIYWKQTKQELFKPNFKAWKFGPVIEDIYYEIQKLPKYNGYNPVPEDAFKDFDNEEINFDQLLVEKIIDNLNSFSVWRLVEMSHLTDPWKNAKQSKLISKKSIQTYFNDKNVTFN